MSYETRVDNLIAHHIAEYEAERRLANLWQGLPRASSPAKHMPYGYPLRVYRPCHICHSRKTGDFDRDGYRRLSNGVPWVLAMELVDNYVLGLYNPCRC